MQKNHIGPLSKFDNGIAPAQELNYMMRDTMVPSNPSLEQKNAHAPLEPLKTCSGQLVFFCDGQRTMPKTLKCQLLNLPNDLSS